MYIELLGLTTNCTIITAIKPIYWARFKLNFTTNSHLLGTNLDSISQLFEFQTVNRLGLQLEVTFTKRILKRYYIRICNLKSN